MKVVVVPEQKAYRSLKEYREEFAPAEAYLRWSCQKEKQQKG